MKFRIAVIGATLATLFVGSAFATAQADALLSMTVDQSAPVRATLLPTVSVDATPGTSATNPATMRVADTAPFEVTLLPTVHVTARGNPGLAVTLLPTVYVTAASAATESEPIVDGEDIAQGFPAVADKATTTFERPLGLRARTMPR